MIRAVALGVPMGLLPAADLIGLALFQLMQAAQGTIAGAATQIAMMMTSLAYMPAVGIAIAGTTLVGQSIGAGDRDRLPDPAAGAGDDNDLTFEGNPSGGRHLRRILAPAD